MMITKELIREYKVNNNFSDVIDQYKDNRADLIYILEHLGKLPADFNGSWLIPMMYNENKDVRLNAVKNIAKLKLNNIQEQLFQIAKNDECTLVRREAVSAIGRMRSKDAIPYLIEFLKDDDPKIICQAIRGLLVFKGNEYIDDKLKNLINHENEIIRSVVNKEYHSEDKKKRNILAHKDSYPYLRNVVVNGDVREILKFVPDESFHLTFTSPPYYNARDYSIYSSYDAYLNFLEEVFIETHRVTKEGRFLIVNTSPVIVPRISRAHSSKRYPIPFDLHNRLVNNDWEFIDDIIWMKPEFSVKNRIGGFQQHRKPLAYKPNTITEYLMVYRKKTEKLLDWNIHQYDNDIVNESLVSDNYEKTNVWHISPKSDKVHSAVFPVELCSHVLRYYSFKGDLVFDPFGGSGTFGRTAKSLGRKFFITEISEEYFEYMKSFENKGNLFENEKTKFITSDEFKNIIL